jgi:hypothetical protein
MQSEINFPGRIRRNPRSLRQFHRKALQSNPIRQARQVQIEFTINYEDYSVIFLYLNRHRLLNTGFYFKMPG